MSSRKFSTWLFFTVQGFSGESKGRSRAEFGGGTNAFLCEKFLNTIVYYRKHCLFRGSSHPALLDPPLGKRRTFIVFLCIFQRAQGP